MPIVKIVAPGWETYNGVIEGVRFENGQSVEPLSQAAAERLGCFMRIETLEGEQVSLTKRMVDNYRKNIEDHGLPHTQLKQIESAGEGQEKAPAKKTAAKKTAAKKSKAKSVEPQSAEPAPVSKYPYTREELEAIADKEGLPGIRDFAKSYEVVGPTIVEIIETLMAKKKAAEQGQKQEQ